LEIQQSFTVPFALDQVWRCFHDIERIIGCLPGAGMTEPPREGKLALSMMVKLGPIVANFAGQGEMALDETARRGRITGGGSDRKSGSRVKGEASFALHEERAPAASTRIDIRVDYSIAGSLAQFSRGGIVRELAEKMTAQFSDNLRKLLDAETPLPIPTPSSTLAPAAPLDLGKMFWPMLIARLKRWFGLSAKRSDDARSRGD
jgi:carbon monoxide dehydrogenase subunit G